MDSWKDKYRRHVCNACKKKLYEKDMEQSPKQTRYGKNAWICFQCKGEGREVYIY